MASESKGKAAVSQLPHDEDMESASTVTRTERTSFPRPPRMAFDTEELNELSPIEGRFEIPTSLERATPGWTITRLIVNQHMAEDTSNQQC
jgi:hypothetical protein